MNIDYPALMALKSDEDLQLYLTDAARYTDEAVDAAIKELSIRGVGFSEADLAALKADIALQKKIKEKGLRIGNQVTDPAAPLLYSPRTIVLFTFFFGTFPGAMLFAINIKNHYRKEGRAQVLVFGFIYHFLVLAAATAFNIKSGILGFMWACNILPAALMYLFFWKKYIGKDTLYRRRSSSGEFLILFILSLAILFFTIVAANFNGILG